MNEREKALDALNSVMFGQTKEGHRTATELDRTIRNYLSKPSFDDAIKCIEKIVEKNQIELSEHNDDRARNADLIYQNQIYGDVLSALKEVLR